MPRTRSRSGIRRFSRKKGDRVWSSVTTLGDALVVGTTEGVFAVLGSDWERSPDTLDRATLLRIRGHLSVTNATGANGDFVAAILVQDEDEPSPDMTLASSLVDEDILWHSSGRVPVTQSFAVEREIDVKAKRRLKNSDNVVFLIVALTAAQTYTLSLRSLVNAS